MRYYSQSTGCTYLPAIHGDNMPADAVLIPEARFVDVIANPAPGKIRSHDADGLPILIDPPPPSAEQIAKQYEQEAQAHMDAAARAAGYDDIKTAVTYADEPAVPKFQQDGQAFRAWRSLCWAYAYEQLAAVQAGLREQPSVEDFIAELPVLELPA